MKFQRWWDIQSPIFGGWPVTGPSHNPLNSARMQRYGSTQKSESGKECALISVVVIRDELAHSLPMVRAGLSSAHVGWQSAEILFSHVPLHLWHNRKAMG